MNYRGYFNSLQCKQYRVDIIADSGNSYTEIPLAANNPFVVTFDTSSTPFEPIRKSRATINIVYDEYLADALSSCAQGTKVKFYELTGNSETLLWSGYLTPNTLDAGYNQCYENFSLEASDFLSSLQYKDYEYLNGGGLTNVKDIIISILNACSSEVDKFFWTCSKKATRQGNPYILPEHLIISEHNFTSNDTDEKWKMSEVLEELCKYLGFTCIQWGKDIYFVDYQQLEVYERLFMAEYRRSGTSAFTRYTTTYYFNPHDITADDVMGNDASISFEGIYNHIMVKDNLYAADEFIPNPFDDDYLKNRNGEFYTAVRIPHLQPHIAEYPNGNDWLGQKYVKEEVSDSGYTYMHRLYDNDAWESIYYNSAGTRQYLTSAQTADSAITRDYLGGTIVDMGVVRNNYVSETWQWIIPSRMDYTRYLCISEKHNNNQVTLHGSMRPTSNLTGKVVFKLKSAYTPTVMLDDDSFLVFSYSAIWERYWNRNYINPDWTDTKCQHNWNALGDYYNEMPKARFKLKIGDKCWSTYYNAWVDASDSRNYMEPAPKWEDNEYNYWNEEMTILNNVSWEDKINADGLKIPLSGIDVTQGIEFEVQNPRPLFYGNGGNPNYENKYFNFNEYVWLKDLSLKCMQAYQDDEGNENDVVYENSLSGCSVNDLDNLTLKITTHKEKIKPSYSHMVYKYNSTDKPIFLKAVKEAALSDNAQKPEQNIIEKYVHQYSTPTKKISITLSSDITPFDKVYGIDVEDEDNQIGYVQLGTEIDYRTDRQSITYIQKKKEWNS